MKPLSVVLLNVLLSFSSHSQTTSISDSEQANLSKFLVNFFDAVKDKNKDVMNKSLDDGFTLISSDSNGEQIRKQNYINGVMLPDYLKVTACTLSDFKFIGQNDVIIANFRIQWESLYKGKPWNANFLNTDVLIRSGDSYKILYRHTSYPASQLKRIVEERYSDSR